MAIVETIKDFVGSIVTHNYTELPVKIQDGVNKYLKDDENIIFNLMNYRAVYRAPKFIDSNTFFNSWFILTTHRIIIAKNGRYAQDFAYS